MAKEYNSIIVNSGRHIIRCIVFSYTINSLFRKSEIFKTNDFFSV